jgi:hypothetical protein
MKIDFPSLIERFAKLAGLVPVPLLDTFHSLLYARTIMAATKLGVFEALEAAPASADEVAKRCGTDLRATRALLDAVTGTGTCASPPAATRSLPSRASGSSGPARAPCATT